MHARTQARTLPQPQARTRARKPQAHPPLKDVLLVGAWGLHGHAGAGGQSWCVTGLLWTPQHANALVRQSDSSTGGGAPRAVQHHHRRGQQHRMLIDLAGEDEGEGPLPPPQHQHQQQQHHHQQHQQQQQQQYGSPQHCSSSRPASEHAASNPHVTPTKATQGSSYPVSLSSLWRPPVKEGPNDVELASLSRGACVRACVRARAPATRVRTHVQLPSAHALAPRAHAHACTLAHVFSCVLVRSYACKRGRAHALLHRQTMPACTHVRPTCPSRAP